MVKHVALFELPDGGSEQNPRRLCGLTVKGKVIKKVPLFCIHSWVWLKKAASKTAIKTANVNQACETTVPYKSVNALVRP